MTENEPQTSELKVTAGGRTEIPAVVDIDPDQVASPALKRLLEEVRNEETGCNGEPYAYDRTHNTHNRGR
jgi:hypothetical protein